MVVPRHLLTYDHRPPIRSSLSASVQDKGLLIRPSKRHSPKALYHQMGGCLIKLLPQLHTVEQAPSTAQDTDDDTLVEDNEVNDTTLVDAA